MYYLPDYDKVQAYIKEHWVRPAGIKEKHMTILRDYSEWKSFTYNFAHMYLLDAYKAWIDIVNTVRLKEMWVTISEIKAGSYVWDIFVPAEKFYIDRNQAQEWPTYITSSLL